MSFFDDVNKDTVSQASDGFKSFKLGDNHACISKVEETTSREGHPMLVITFTDEEGATIRYRIMEGEYKLSRLKQLYSAFGIPIGETNIKRWIGKWGTVVCRDGKPYEGKIYKEVHFLRHSSGNLSQDNKAKQQEQKNHGYNESHANSDYFTDDIPF